MGEIIPTTYTDLFRVYSNIAPSRNSWCSLGLQKYQVILHLNMFAVDVCAAYAISIQIESKRMGGWQVRKAMLQISDYPNENGTQSKNKKNVSFNPNRSVNRSSSLVRRCCLTMLLNSNIEKPESTNHEHGFHAFFL